MLTPVPTQRQRLSSVLLAQGPRSGDGGEQGGAPEAVRASMEETHGPRRALFEVLDDDHLEMEKLERE